MGDKKKTRTSRVRPVDEPCEARPQGEGVSPSQGEEPECVTTEGFREEFESCGVWPVSCIELAECCCCIFRTRAGYHAFICTPYTTCLGCLDFFEELGEPTPEEAVKKLKGDYFYPGSACESCRHYEACRGILNL